VVKEPDFGIKDPRGVKQSGVCLFFPLLEILVYTVHYVPLRVLGFTSDLTS
jgi:hypothetical protein